MLPRRTAVLAGIVGLIAGATPVLAQSYDTVMLRDELMGLEKASWGYVKDKNFDGMKGYLADDALLIFSDGARYNKREFLAFMQGWRLDSFVIEPTYAVRVISPDVATLLYRVVYTGAVKGGKPETSYVIASSVYVRRNDKWWSVLYQETSRQPQ
jgi:hypothetical protein